MPVEARLELQVAAGDLFLLRVPGQPALALRQQLLHLVVADEVVLLVVEDRDQDVQVRQQLRQRGRLAGPSPRSTGSRPTRGTARRAGGGRPRPRSPAARTPPAGTVSPPRTGSTSSRAVERDRRRRQLGPVLAAALEGRAEDLGDRHAQERRGDVGPVVDVLREQEVLVGALAPDHAPPGPRRAAGRPCSARRRPRGRRRGPCRSSGRTTGTAPGACAAGSPGRSPGGASS